MAGISDWQTTLMNASSTVLQSIFGFLPSLFAALIIFFFGLLLARWLKNFTIKALKGIKFNSFSKKIGVDKFLEKAEIQIHIEEIVGNIVKWIIIFIFFTTAVNILGLTAVSNILNTVLASVPKILSAAFVFTAGVLLAGLVESLIKGSVAQVDVRIGRLAGKFASWLVIVFATLAAVNELGIAQSLINILFIGVVAMLALGIGLALGLGAKDLVAEVLKDWYKKLQKDMKK